MNTLNTLPEWLNYLENLHSSSIDMSLERVRAVAEILNLKADFPLVIVAGTNGKGSVCALLSTIYLQAGYKVGTYTSPHILHYNERIAVNLANASDQDIVNCFAAIENARGAITLTYFEFGTLAAMLHFVQQRVEVAVLEVGLGGRLDAINIFDADVAVVTNIDLDHTEYLGNTREAIAYEKAGIFRAWRHALCADREAPASLLAHAKAIGAQLSLIDHEFGAKKHNQHWDFYSEKSTFTDLPLPALFGDYQLDNATLALAALDALDDKLPVSIDAIRHGLNRVVWMGRFQLVLDNPQVILDVGHNPHAALALVANLKQLPKASCQRAVFSMLADKDIASVIDITRSSFDEWYVAGLSLPRGMTSQEITSSLSSLGVNPIHSFNTLAEAYQAALLASGKNDRIIVFGSFHTVAAVQEEIQHTKT